MDTRTKSKLTWRRAGINPSAENIAEWFHRELSSAVAGENAVVTAITVWEGPVNSVTFRAGE